MILRRLAESIRRQDWFTVVLEVLIVVLGVFIGIEVANWNESRADRAREQRIIVDMLADLEIDRAQYANALGMAPRRLAAVTASLEGAGLPPITFDYQAPRPDIVSYGIEGPGAASTPTPRHERLWTDIVIGYFPTPSTSTYDAIVGAGDISIIRDRDLVREIQVYRNLIGGVTRQNDKLISVRADTLNIGARYGLAPYVDIPPDDYFRLVADEKELAASIRIMTTFGIFHEGEIASTDRRAAQLQERLRAYLEEGTR